MNTVVHIAALSLMAMESPHSLALNTESETIWVMIPHKSELVQVIQTGLLVGFGAMALKQLRSES